MTKHVSSNGILFGEFGSADFNGQMASAFFVRCKCGKKKPYPCPRNAPPELARKGPLKDGWETVKGGRCMLCPECSSKRRDSRKKVLTQREPDVGTAITAIGAALGSALVSATIKEPAAMQATAPQANQPRPNGASASTPVDVSRYASPAKQYQILKDIEGCFDPKAGRYLEGYSDETIAKDHGVGPTVVKMVREPVFGQIKVDADILALEARLSQALDYLARIEKDIAVLKAKRGV